MSKIIEFMDLDDRQSNASKAFVTAVYSALVALLSILLFTTNLLRIYEIGGRAALLLFYVVISVLCVLTAIQAGQAVRAWGEFLRRLNIASNSEIMGIPDKVYVIETDQPEE